MKRLHVHVAVEDLPQSIGFYSALFAAQPSVVKADYAKWMLDDPRVNFAISARGRQAGLDHLGIQVESAAELGEVYGRLREAGGNVIEQGQTACCYAKSEKSWIDDPGGRRMGDLPHHRREPDYGDGTERAARVAHQKSSACCVRKVAASPPRPAATRQDGVRCVTCGTPVNVRALTMPRRLVAEASAPRCWSRRWSAPASWPNASPGTWRSRCSAIPCRPAPSWSC